MSKVKTTKNSRKKAVVKTTSTKKTKNTQVTTKKQTSTNDKLVTIPIFEFQCIDVNEVKFPNCLANNIKEKNNQEIIDKVCVADNNSNEIKLLTNENILLVSKNNNLEQKVNDLSNKLIELENLLSTNKEENKHLSNHNNSLNKEINNLKQNEIKFNNQINHLNQINGNLNNEINVLRTKISLQQDELNKKQTPPPPPIPNQNNDENNNQNNDDNTQQKENEWLEKQKVWESQRKQLEDKVQSLSIELENERQQLINKLQAKSKQAQEMIDQKLLSLEEENKEKINNIKIKVYEDVISKFLDPINLFEQTILSSASNPAISNYLQGFNMIVNMFKDNLSILGADEIDIKIGDEFNPNWMSAFDTIDGSGLAPNHVVKIVSKGFAFNGKVLKFASVIVSK